MDHHVKSSHRKNLNGYHDGVAGNGYGADFTDLTHNHPAYNHNQHTQNNNKTNTEGKFSRIYIEPAPGIERAVYQNEGVRKNGSEKDLNHRITALDKKIRYGVIQIHTTILVKDFVPVFGILSQKFRIYHSDQLFGTPPLISLFSRCKFEIRKFTMDYFENQILLKSCFDLQSADIAIPGSGTHIRNCSFQSVIKPDNHDADRDTKSVAGQPDLLARSFEGNYNFTYPVFMPQGVQKASGAIVMLHGLNERNWLKYLYWAQYLCDNTGKAVILFPMAFHVNRSPGYWSDPRAMQEVFQQRVVHTPENTVATPFNAALSARLDSHPEWFCTSGLQSCYDLISLSQMIRSGRHPLLTEGASIDFFAYSVGAFLLEVLLIANPEELFAESKSFLFLGGSSFEQMQGISRYIMDTRAFNQLDNAFLRQNPSVIRKKINIEHLNTFSGLWSGFMAMLRLGKHEHLRERSFYRLRNQISAVGLALDQVIPAKSILRTLAGSENRNKIPMKIMDFPYPYSHENPFPTGNQHFRPQVNESFHQVFSGAVKFLG